MESSTRRWIPGPPWLLAWAGWVVWDRALFLESWQAMWAVSTGDLQPEVAAQPWAWTVQLVQGTRLAVEVALVAALVLLLVPAWRGRYVERRWGLTAPAVGRGGAVAEIIAFVRSEVPVVEVRVNLRRADQLAFAYAGGFRSPRLAVFAGLVKLWRTDRGVAEAVLLHELAHVSRGDHLVSGAGSPVAGVLRWSGPVVLGLALLPAFVPDPLGLIRGFVWFDPFVLLARLVLPIGALWMSEIDADRAVTCRGRSLDLRRALDRVPPKGGAASLIRLATHPPMALRRLLAGRNGFGRVLACLGFPLLRLVQFVPLVVGVVLAVSNQVGGSVGSGWTMAVDLVEGRLGSVAVRAAVDVAVLVAWTTWFARYRRGRAR